MKKAIMALIVSLILLFAAGKPALTLAGEYADFEDDSSDAFFEFDEEQFFGVNIFGQINLK